MAGRDRYKTDTWYHVPFKTGRGSRSVAKSSMPVDITKFFVSNLPGGCGSNDLVDALKGFGQIHGTYIARKFDKLGKRFGFVSFTNVRDVGKLESDLKDVWIGSYKLFITLARFVDGEKVLRKKETRWEPVKEVDNPKNNMAEKRVEEPAAVVDERHNFSGMGNRSFRDTLINKEVFPGEVEISVPPNTQAFSQWNGTGLIGRAKDFGSLTNLNRLLPSSSRGKISIRYVGGLYVMLVFQNQEERMLFLEDKEVWLSFFSMLECWEGQLLNFERIAWVKIFGVPLCLADNGVFNEIGSKVGLVVQSAQFADEEQDLSYALVGIICNKVDRVNEKMVLKWRDMSFPVLIEEECGEWIPDCIVAMEDDGGRNLSPVHEAEETFEKDDINTEEEVVVLDEEVPVNVEGNGDGAMFFGGGVSKVKEVFSKHFSDMSVGVEGKKKKGKFSRKKSRAEKSVSPLEQARPKKRARDGDDPFDVDRFIFNLNDTRKEVQQGEQVQQSPNMFLTPDLNREVEGEQVSPLVDRGESGTNLFSQRIDEEVAVEASETVILGKVLGAENIESFKDNLVNSIVEEGFQGVDK